MLAGLKLDDDNYDVWQRKIQYLMNNDDCLDFISKEVARQVGNTTIEQKWFVDEVKKDRSARFIVFTCKANVILHELEKIRSTKVMWDSRRHFKLSIEWHLLLNFVPFR